MRNTIAAFLLLGASSPVYAQEWGPDKPEWYWVDANRNVAVFVDAAGMKNGETKPTVWVTMIFPQSNADGITQRLAQEEYDCASGYRRTLTLVTYWSFLKRQSEPGNGEPFYPRAGTMGASIFKFVCSNEHEGVKVDDPKSAAAKFFKSNP